MQTCLGGPTGSIGLGGTLTRDSLLAVAHALCAFAALGPESCLVDVGCGTGM